MFFINIDNSEYVETNELSSMNEYSYIIIKNFEAKKISSDTAINMLFEKIDAMKENITIEEILELLYFNFVAILDIKSETDSKKLKEYLKNMLASLNNNWNMMKKKLIEMLSSIKIYSEIEETTYRKKLSHVFIIYLIIINFYSFSKKIKDYSFPPWKNQIP